MDAITIVLFSLTLPLLFLGGAEAYWKFLTSQTKEDES